MANKCNINNPYDFTCFSMKSLRSISDKIDKNTFFSGSINSKKYKSKDKKKLANAISKKLSCSSSLDMCILKNKNFTDEVRNAFKPPKPTGGKYAWLSTVDIRNVMNQYMKKYPEFIFFGPVPLDFDNIYMELAKINMKSLSKKKKKIGIIINTDTSDGPGEHWISLFCDLQNKTICFFDSVGTNPPKQVMLLIRRMIKQAKSMGIKLKLITNTHQRQFSNTECGVFSCYFLISRLMGQNCGYIFKDKKVTDKLMKQKRCEYFRKC